MGQSFSGKAEFAGRTRTTEASIKLEAAKTELLRSVASLASVTPIALFEFISTASLIYEGMSNNQTAIQRALDALDAWGETCIEAALDKASEYAAKLRNVPIIQVLVISDGLSTDRVSAEAAAQRFAQQGTVIINVILIDPTEYGEQVARAIAVNGEVYAVTSSDECLPHGRDL
jgi:Mg-chelatase subunit ChlD